MPDSILRTKIYRPPLRPNFVTRPHLVARLDQGLHLGHKLTLISAPAGFGKSTLASTWVARAARPAAWLSLDDEDNELRRFLIYLISALQTVDFGDADEGVPTLGSGALTLLHTPQPPPAETVLTQLINDIMELPGDFMLVLDDYQLIDSQAVDEALAFLLDYMPPQMHIVISTREDLNLPLAAMRGRGQLSELRAADLRFSLDEAAEFLNRVMGLELSTEDVAALDGRTEGWIAGLQLAAISMQGRDDIEGLVRSFTGSHRFVLDYLIAEVLEQQSPELQRFLLQTAVLDRLSASLCSAVTGQDNGQETLNHLERANLFVVPLDEERQWFRYHHLFADLLRKRLQQTKPQQIPKLHARASEWYEQAGLPIEALKQAQAAGNQERVATLAELTWTEMDESFQSALWLTWVQGLPDALVSQRPVLCAQVAAALINNSVLEAAEIWLRRAERWLEAGTAQDTAVGPQMIVADEAQFAALPGTIAYTRASHAQYLGDEIGAVKYAQEALEQTAEDDYLRRSQAAAILGISYWSSGDLEAANEALTEWIASMHRIGNLTFAVASAFAVADIMIELGRLKDAVQAYEDALQVAAAQEDELQQITAHHHLGLGMLYFEMAEEEKAGRFLAESERLSPLSTLIDWPFRRLRSQALRRQAEGDLAAALELFDQAQRAYVRNPAPVARPVEALKARIYIAQGRLDRARDWAGSANLAVDDELSYLREFEHMTLARLLMAEYERGGSRESIQGALSLLDRLEQEAKAARRYGNLIEVFLLQALAYRLTGDLPQALGKLQGALRLAEPQGYRRIFVAEGAPLAELLSVAAARGVMDDYATELLALFPITAETPIAAAPIEDANRILAEPLSARELEVLQLVAAGLTNREIAERLFLAQNTVKVHVRNIYGKLDVHHRAQAVARANDLGLLSPQ